MYYCTYTDPGNAPTDLPPILLDVKVFTIADKYMIETLKGVARKKFQEHCTGEWATSEFATAVEEIYATCLDDETMKDIVISTAKAHIKEYLDGADDHIDIRTAMKEIPAFSADILAKLGETDFKVTAGDLKVTRHRCGQCGCEFPLGHSDSYPNMRFSCPNGHYANNTYSWWSSYPA